MSDSEQQGKPVVTLDVRVPLSVNFEQVGDRLNFVLEEHGPTVATDKAASSTNSTAKYELYQVNK